MPLRLPWYKEKMERKATLGMSDELGSFFTFGTSYATTAASALRLYEQSSAVSIPINMIADNFKVMEPILLVDGKLVQHEVIQFLKKPSPYFSAELFLETIAKDYLITGEFITIALGGISKAPLELQPISPKNLTVVQGQGGLPRDYQVAGNSLPGSYVPIRRGKDIRYIHGAMREMTFVRSWSTKDNSLLRGMSPLVSAAKEARQHILGGDHNVSLLEKGGRISLVFHFKADMDEEDFQDARERVISQYGGATKAGTIGVTAGEELEIKEVGINNRDMDFAALQKMAVKAVALQYHVPLPLVADERQTLNNYREGKVALYDDAVIPLSRLIFGGLGRILLQRFGLDPNRARITFDPDQVSSLVSRRNDELAKRKNIDVETDNEIRALMGREPVEGGDILYKPANLVPIGTDTFTADNEVDVIESVDA